MTEPQQGYEVPRTILRLQFTDPSFDGLEVRAYEAPTGAIERIGGLAYVDPQAALSQDAYTVVLAARDDFAKALVDWNLHDQGQPVPATAEGVGSLPIPFVWQLVGAWVDGTRQVLQAALAAREVDEADLAMEIAG